nr:HepT-like ribonuclease domain-containing protein [Desulfallas sp. Bu1-1]
MNKIERYTNNMSFQDFLQNELVQDSVARNLEIIGEAVKKIPDNIKRQKPEIEWKKIAFEYFSGMNIGRIQCANAYCFYPDNVVFSVQ